MAVRFQIAKQSGSKPIHIFLLDSRCFQSRPLQRTFQWERLGVVSPHLECFHPLLGTVFDHFRLPQECEREGIRLNKLATCAKARLNLQR